MIQNIFQNVLPSDKNERIVKIAVTGDTTWPNIVSTNYLLQYMVFEETAGNQATLDCGTSDGGNDVFTGQIIAASDITTIVINKVFSLSSATTLDLNDDQIGSLWNGASVNMALILKSVT